VGFVVLACLAVSSCTGVSTTTRPGAPVAPQTRSEAYLQLKGEVDTFHVAGTVKTSQGFLLPERIVIEIHSEICVESRNPGSRFWSLDYDTCFAFVAVDTVDEAGAYSVWVPCLDADKDYQSRHSFGDLRLVQRGPVAFTAESDAGWRHQETFSSSRSQRRDLVLTLEPETFYVVREEGLLQARPAEGAEVLRRYKFGTGIDVIRFQKGWAQCLMEDRIGWMEMRYLGTEAEMRESAPFKEKRAFEPLDQS
jgi:hypothetical protein